MWNIGLGAGARQSFNTKGLHALHGTNHVAVEIDVAHMGGMGLGAAGQAMNRCCGLGNDFDLHIRTAVHLNSIVWE